MSIEDAGVQWLEVECATSVLDAHSVRSCMKMIKGFCFVSVCGDQAADGSWSLSCALMLASLTHLSDLHRSSLASSFRSLDCAEIPRLRCNFMLPSSTSLFV